MEVYRGSEWSRWDLHVHSPASHVHNYPSGDAGWEKFIQDLEALPPEFKALGINDYLFLDGYRQIREAKRHGKLKNIKLLLPVIEFRLDKFGGSQGALSKVNFHVIFSDELDVEVIQHQFLSAIQSKFVLTPEYDHLRESGSWASTPTTASLKELGEKIRDSSPPEMRSTLPDPLTLGFNNLCISGGEITRALRNPVFAHKYVTAVGKTEWADIKWSSQAIADKKTIINGADFVFTAAPDEAAYAKSLASLREDRVNSRLLDCSDAHALRDAPEKDRIGNCLTWIKGDHCFETLRQAKFDFDSRVCVSNAPPLMPLLTINEVDLSFPDDSQIVSSERTDPLCWRGKHTIGFSPYLTCLVGGRGTGKSTLLNIIHEKLRSGENEFFRANYLLPEQCTVDLHVVVDRDVEKKEIEFFAQNEIEAFATDPGRLTEAIFSRLDKLNPGSLPPMEAALREELKRVTAQRNRVVELDQLSSTIDAQSRELETNRRLVSSIQSNEYRELNETLTRATQELQALRAGKERFDNIIVELRALASKFDGAAVAEGRTAYEQEVRSLLSVVALAVSSAETNAEVMAANQRAEVLTAETSELRGRVNAFLSARGFSPENLADVSRAAEKIASLVSSIPLLKQRAEQLRSAIAQYKASEGLHVTYAENVNQLLAPINERLRNLSAEVKPIELQFSFDKSLLEREAYQLLQEMLPSEDRSLRSDHIAHMLPSIDFAGTINGKAVAEKIQDRTKTGRALKEFFEDNVRSEVFALGVREMWLDLRKYRRINVLYDGRPLSASSFGQKCTAAIVVLLLFGNAPIVIDEPEAHLDSSLIAKYLVSLVKEVKKNRQIVFATHNANFVINGDAELVLVLDMSADAKSVISATSIENMLNRDRLLALEGGKEAFQLRENRYGIGRAA